MSNQTALKVLVACQPDASDRTNWSIIALWEAAFRDRQFPMKSFDMFGIVSHEKDFSEARRILFDAAINQLAAVLNKIA